MRDTLADATDRVNYTNCTLQWDYMNGLGSSIDRFSIMLYPANCEGGMVANLCDKPSIGCKDSSKFLCDAFVAGVFFLGLLPRPAARLLSLVSRHARAVRHAHTRFLLLFRSLFLHTREPTR